MYAAQVFFNVSITLKCRVYLIKIKNVLANFDSEKQFKVKKAYFMEEEIDLIEEKNHFWQRHAFWMKVRLNFKN